KPPGKGRMVPVRFISICPDGHLDDLPWARWLGCPVEADGQTPQAGHELSLRDLGGENLSSIRVRCRCGREESLQGITRTRVEPQSEQSHTTLTDELNRRNGPPAGFCCGRRPWIGPDECTRSCGKPIVGALLSGSNVYFARTQTSIYIPQDTAAGVEDIVVELQRELCNLPKFLNIKMKWQSGQRQDALDAASAPLRRAVPALKDRDEDEEKLLRQAIEAAVEGRPVLQAKAPEPSGPEAGEVRYRRVEFNSIRQAYDNPAEPDLRIREAGGPESLKDHVERGRLIEKLRARRVFLGFDRVRPGTKYGRAAAEDALGQLFHRYPTDEESRWLPGIETRGEGIYIELKERAIRRWLDDEENREFLRRRLPP